MHLAVLWLAVLLLFLSLEAATVNLVSVWFAGGALAAMIAALCGAKFLFQLLLFVAVSAVLLLALYPVAKKLVKGRKRTKTNADRILDLPAIVTEPIDNLKGTGAIKVDGKIWSARSQDDTCFCPGETVRITKIEGVRAIVVPDHVSTHLPV